MSSQELHSDGVRQGGRRERMAVSVAGSEPSFQIWEEWKESTTRELGQLLKRKFQELEENVEEGYEGREAKKRKADDYGCLGLRFTGQIPDRIFTMDKVKAENTKDLCVELIDTRTGEVVTSGPESSMKVQLDILRGEFEGAETGNCSLKCFEHYILPRKKDNGQQLLKGDDLTLNEGIAVVDNLKITTNSRCTFSGRFRLAARLTAGDFKGMRVKEAITNAFVVKENRGKPTEKSDIPRPKDPVWKLKGIRKDSETNQQLTKNGIHTVEDFLKSLNESEDELRDISGMRTNLWEDAVKHARRCPLSGKRILRPLSNQQSNHVYDVAQPKKVFGGSPSELIDSIPGGSSKPEIQQQHVPSQAFAGSSNMGGKNVDVSRASGDDAFGNFPKGFGFDENYISFEDLYNQMTTNSTDEQDPMTGSRQEEYNASSAGVFLNISAESTDEREHTLWTKEFR